MRVGFRCTSSSSLVFSLCLGFLSQRIYADLILSEPFSSLMRFVVASWRFLLEGRFSHGKTEASLACLSDWVSSGFYSAYNRPLAFSATKNIDYFLCILSDRGRCAFYLLSRLPLSPPFFCLSTSFLFISSSFRVTPLYEQVFACFHSSALQSSSSL